MSTIFFVVGFFVVFVIIVVLEQNKYAKKQLRPKSEASKDYYSIIGVERTADEKQIRDAYLLRSYLIKDSDSQAYKDLNEAYEVLLNQSLRRAYDNLHEKPETFDFVVNHLGRFIILGLLGLFFIYTLISASNLKIETTLISLFISGIGIFILIRSLTSKYKNL